MNKCWMSRLSCLNAGFLLLAGLLLCVGDGRVWFLLLAAVTSEMALRTAQTGRARVLSSFAIQTAGGFFAS